MYAPYEVMPIIVIVPSGIRCSKHWVAFYLFDLPYRHENICLLISLKSKQLLYKLRLHDVALDFKLARGIGLHGRQFAVHQIEKI